MSDCMIVFIIFNLKNGSENYFLVLADLVQGENKESRGEYLGLPTLSDEGCNTLLELFASSERELVEQCMVQREYVKREIHSESELHGSAFPERVNFL